MTKTFTQTSDALYDKHDYKVVYTNGQSTTVDCYEDVYRIWVNTPQELVSHVEVLNKKANKKKKGFS